MSREKQLEKLVVTLEAQTAKYKADLEKARSKSKDFAKSTKKDALDIKGALAGIGFAYGVKSIIDATTKQEQATKQLEQGLKSTANAAGFSLSQLTKFASELQSVTTFGDEDIIAAQSQLVTFTKITGDEFKRTMKAALDLSTRMDKDLKSSVQQLAKALNDPIANLGSLSESGIQFSKEQKELIKSLVETGRMADAQRVILAELETQFGGSAVAARETFGGALEALNNAFGDLLETSGGLEDARQSVEGLTSLLSDPSVVAGINKITTAIVAGFSGALHFITDVANAIEFLAEEFAAFVHGPAIGDLVRLEDQLADVNAEIAELESRKSRSNAGNKLNALRRERDLLEEKLKLTRSMNSENVKTIEITKGIQESQEKMADLVKPALSECPKPNEKDDKEIDPAFRFVNDPEKLDKFSRLMEEYGEVSAKTAEYIEHSFTHAFNSMTENLSRGLAQAIVEGESLKDVFGQVAKTLAIDLVAGLIKVGAQMLINAAFGKAAQTEATVAGIISGNAVAAAWAPAAAFTSLASFGANAAPAQVGLSTTVSLSSALALTGMAHDGIANVPREGTWLLDKGERVLSAGQNKEFSDFMKDGGAQSVNVTNVFQISAGVEGTVRAEIEKMVPAIERLSVSSVERAIRNGGSLARTVGVR